MNKFDRILNRSPRDSNAATSVTARSTAILQNTMERVLLMRLKQVLWLIVVVGLIGSANSVRATVVLQDDFEDGVIDPVKWQELNGDPVNNTIDESGGSLNMETVVTETMFLVTQNEWDPATEALKITGSGTFGPQGLVVWTRSGNTGNTGGGPAHVLDSGIRNNFWLSGNSVNALEKAAGGWPWFSVTTTEGVVPDNAATDWDFEIIDDGTTINMTVTQTSDPANTATGVFTSSTVFGSNHVAFQVNDGSLNEVTIETLVFDPFVRATVDRTTGALTILNGTGVTVSGILGYSFTSEIGAIAPAGWTSIADNYDVDGDKSVDADDEWTELTAASSRADLSEFQLIPGLGAGDGGEIAHNGAISLGNVWIKNPNEDLLLELVYDDGSKQNLIVEFEGNGGVPFTVGDLNFDGTVNTLDWLTLQSNALADLSALSTAEAYGFGDLDGDNDNDIDDFDLFVEAVGGPAAFQAMIAGVPEPSSLVLIGLGCVACCFARRRSARTSEVRKDHGREMKGREMKESSTMMHKSFFFSLVAMSFLMAGGQANATVVLQDDFEDGVIDPVKWQELNGDPVNNTIDESGGSLNMETVVTETMFLVTQNEWDPATEALKITGSGTFGPQGLVVWTRSGNTGNTGGGPAHVLDSGIRNNFWLSGNSVNALEKAAGGWPWFSVTTTEGVVPDNAATDWDFEIIDDGTTINMTVTQTSDPANTATGVFTSSTVFGSNHVAFQVNDGSLNEVTIEISSLPSVLTLLVNPSTGGTALFNETGAPVDFNSYQITSASNSLDAVGWNSLQEQDYEGSGGTSGTGDGWEEMGGAAAHALGESYLDGSSTLTDQGFIGLGQAFNDASTQDLVFQFRDATSEAVKSGLVKEVLSGDMDGDGDVDVDDVNPFVQALTDRAAYDLAHPGVLADLVGDVDGSGKFDLGDISKFKALVSSPGTGSATSVPEPSSLVLLVFCLMAPALTRWRRRSGT